MMVKMVLTAEQNFRLSASYHLGRPDEVSIVPFACRSVCWDN